MKLFAPLLLPPPIQTDIDGEAVKPRRKFRRAVKRIQLAIGPDKRFLGQILAADQRWSCKCECVNHLLVLANQCLKRRMVAVSALRHPARSSSGSAMRFDAN